MPKITKVTPLTRYRLQLTFEDGVSGIVDLSHLAGKGVFELWNDPEVFRSVRIGSIGELVWSDEVDLCPNALYLEVTGLRPEDFFRVTNRQDANA